MRNKEKKSRKGQVSEGITWIFATIAIIIILLFSVFITSAYASGNKKISLSFFSSNINQKSLLSYLLTKESDGGTVYSKIKTEGNLSNFNGNLALKIFNGLYKDNYLQIWVGVSTLGKGIGGTSLNGVDNNFFEKRPSLRASGGLGNDVLKEADYSLVSLEKEKFVEVMFVK